MRTSELAGQVGVNTETLRYYERRGLLTEPPRTPGGHRDYPVSALRMLRFVKRAQELGFTLDEIGQLLHLDSDQCAGARRLAERRRDELAARIRDLQWMHDTLDQLTTACDGEHDCTLLEAIDAEPQ